VRDTGLFTGNKKWKPPTYKSHQAIAAMEDMLSEDITKLIKNNTIRHNISNKDREALISLRQNKSIIIKKADKGGSIVVLDRLLMITLNKSIKCFLMLLLILKLI